MENYITSDMDTAAYLLFLTSEDGLTLVRQTRDDSRRVWLEFAPGDKAREAVTKYVNNQALCPPRLLLDSARTLKSILRQTI